MSDQDIPNRRQQAGDSRYSSNWRWLWNLSKPIRKYQLCGSLCIVSGILASSAEPLAIKRLIDTGVQTHNLHATITVAVVLCGLYVARVALLYVGNRLYAVLSQRLLFSRRVMLIKQVLGRHSEFFLQNAVGDIVRSIESDLELACKLASDLVLLALRIGCSLAFSFIALAIIDWRLTCTIIPCCVIFVSVRLFFRDRLKNASEVTRTAGGSHTSTLTEWIAGALQIQLLVAERSCLRRLARLGRRTLDAAIGQRQIEIKYQSAVLLAHAFVMLTVLLMGAVSVFAKMLSIGGYVAFYSQVSRLFDPLSAAFELYATLQRASASVVRVRNLEDGRSTELSELAARWDMKPIKSLRRPLIQCSHLKFKYQHTQRYILDGVSFELDHGDRVALVGESGSGKSTVAQVLARLLIPEAGGIYVDGSDITGMAVAELRRKVVLVPQVPITFEGTLLENAVLGLPLVSLSELEHFAYVSCFDNVLCKFEKRWQHKLGAGTGLSGGEKQRLAILRALLRRPKVLILDEATSALDSPTEKELINRLDYATRNTGVIMISHRAGIIPWLSRVLTLDNAAIYEHQKTTLYDDPRLVATSNNK